MVVDAFSGAVIGEPPGEGAGPEPTLTVLDQLAWLIWPMEGLEDSEVGAFRVLEVNSAVTPEASERARSRGRSQSSSPTSRSCGASPSRFTPGVTWEPVSVEVSHVPAEKGCRRRGRPLLGPARSRRLERILLPFRCAHYPSRGHTRSRSSRSGSARIHICDHSARRRRHAGFATAAWSTLDESWSPLGG